MKTVRVGCGSANDTDRPELAAQMLEGGDVRYIVFDNLAERTLAFAQLRKLQDPGEGYNPLLRDRMRLILKPALERGVRLLGSMGAANPRRAGEIVMEEAELQGVTDIRVATILGDDVLDLVRSDDLGLKFWETGGGLESLPGEVLSANAYLGASPFLEALRQGAHVVVSGRCSDLAPYIAVLNHEFDWRPDDWDMQGAAAVVGHLLECGRYVTGGAYVDPAYGKMTERLHELSNPLAEVREDGTAIIGKVPGSGGLVTTDTCKEQILHEIHDPSAYLAPDVVVDVRDVRLKPVGPDLVEVSGGRGRPAPDSYKVVVGVAEGWISECEISFPGPGAAEKARLSIDMFRRGLERTGSEFDEIRTDLLGVDSIHGPLSHSDSDPYEVRLRIAGRTPDKASAVAFVVTAGDLWHGPMGGGGMRTLQRQVLGVYSTLVPKSRVPVRVVINERSVRRVA